MYQDINMNQSDMAKNTQQENFSFNKMMKIIIGFAIVVSIFIGIIGWRASNINKNTDQQTQQSLEVGEPQKPELKAVAPASAQTDYVIGDTETADMTIIEYIDLNCSFCKSYHPVLKSVIESSDKKIAWTIRHYPALGSSERSVWLECVGADRGPDAFWGFLEKYYDEVTGTQAAHDNDLFSAWLADNDYDQAVCDREQIAAKVASQHEEGRNAGVTGTPTIVLETRSGEREMVTGSLDQETLESLLDSYLSVN